MPRHGGLVGEDFVAVLALDLHGLLVVNGHDVGVEGAFGGEVLSAALALVIVGGDQALFAEVRRFVAGKNELFSTQ